MQKTKVETREYAPVVVRSPQLAELIVRVLPPKPVPADPRPATTGRTREPYGFD